jgi:hypothetical protein
MAIVTRSGRGIERAIEREFGAREEAVMIAARSDQNARAACIWGPII